MTMFTGMMSIASALARRPREGFRPTSPQHEAGMRIDPPPSFACASGTTPDATSAAEPPDEPPVLCARSPRIAGWTVRDRFGGRCQAELRKCGLADRVQPELLPVPHEARRPGGGCPRRCAGAEGRRIAGDVLVVLDERRNPCERASVGGRFVQPRHDRVQPLHRFGALEGRLPQLTGLTSPAASAACNETTSWVPRASSVNALVRIPRY